MIATLEEDETKRIIEKITEEFKDDYPKFKIDRLDLEFDGANIYIQVRFCTEDPGTGDDLNLEYYIDDTPCYSDPFNEMEDFVTDVLITEIAADIEELYSEEEEE